MVAVVAMTYNQEGTLLHTDRFPVTSEYRAMSVIDMKQAVATKHGYNTGDLFKEVIPENGGGHAFIFVHSGDFLKLIYVPSSTAATATTAAAATTTTTTTGK